MKQEMTFSGKVKEELSRHWKESKHCQIAEMAAILSMCGKVAIVKILFILLYILLKVTTKNTKNGSLLWGK